MKNFFKSVKVKVFFGYFTLVILASLIIWVIFSEILQLSREKVDFNPANNKFIYINNILTNLYQAEGLERNYAQSGQNEDYQEYKNLMNKISRQIDTLTLMFNNPNQQLNTYRIKNLLRIKQQNLRELNAIKKTNSTAVQYKESLKRIPAVKDTINQFAKVYKNLVNNRDTIILKQEKRKFFGWFANVFSSKKNNNSKNSLPENQTVKIDSLIDMANPADSIEGWITEIVTDIRNENLANETRLKQKEQEILDNDLNLTFQLRKVLSNIENEELISSYNKVKLQQARIGKATGLIILLSSVALISIIFFLVNILKDITKSQLYRQNLETAKLYSESLLKSKEQFMLTLTHDLKSPLSSIIGFTGFMKEDDGVSLQHRRYLENINSSSKYILKLVNDLLDLARLESGKLEIESIPFDFNALIVDIVEGFSPQAIAKNIDLQLHFKQLPSAVHMGDPARITQIFSNLISNAINYTDEGTVMVQVSLLTSTENTDQVKVEVVDTGIGISEANYQRIFEDFARVTTTKKQYEGTGLGLTITKKIVDLLNGSISINSKPGEGSNFTIVLTLEKGEQSISIPAKISKGNNHEDISAISGMRIWLVDDDQLLLQMNSIILRSAGADVHIFNDPKKAVSAFYKGCADLLITDIQMPEMNGVELLKQIQIKNGGPFNTIAISGRKPIQNEYDGFTVFIQKPYQAYTLIDVISGLQETLVISHPENDLNKIEKEYNLDQFTAFAEGDPESLKQILVSFLDSSKQNVKLLRQYIEEENVSLISEISHKMLPLFRQLEVSGIIELLAWLEQNDSSELGKMHYFALVKTAAEKVETLLQSISKAENIPVD